MNSTRKIKYLSIVFALAVAFLLPGVFSLKTHAANEETVKVECNLSLGEDIVLNTILSDIPDGYTTANAKFVLSGSEQSFDASVADGKVNFEYTGITPNYFSSTVDIEYTLKGDGVSDMSVVKSFSVDNYVKGVLEKYSADTALKQLVADMYAYGEALKNYAAVGDTAVSNLSGYVPTASVFNEIENPGIKKVSGTSEKLTWVSAALYFDYKVNVAFTFTGNFTNEPTLKIEKNGTEETIDGLVKEENGGKTTYTGIYRSLSLTEYDTEITAVVYDGEEKIGKTASYSVSSGVYAFMNDTDATYKNCVRSVYNYCLSAAEYDRPTDEKKNAYRMEAECSEITFGDTGRNNTDDYLFRFSTKFSGNLAVVNMNKAVGDTRTFAFNSDIALHKVKINMHVGVAYNVTTTLSKYMKVTVNDEEVSLGGLVYGPEDYTQYDGNQFFCFVKASVYAPLKKGENVIKVINNAVNNEAGNLDYVEVVSKANLSGFDNDSFAGNDAEWKIGNKPTLTSEGTVVCGGREYKLPALNPTDYEYDETTNTYSLTVKGKKIFELCITQGEKYTLTIIDKGTTKNYSLEAEETLPEDAKTLLASGFVYASAKNTLVSADNFKMPYEDTTIYAVGTAEGTALTPGNGRGFDVYSGFPSGHRPMPVTTYVYSKTYGAVKGGELTFVPNATEAYGRLQSLYNSDLTVDGFVFHVTIENRNDFAITMDYAQINGGKNKIEGAYQDDITIKAGESIDFTFTFPSGTGSNGNALSLLKFKNVEANVPIVLGLAISYVTPA